MGLRHYEQMLKDAIEVDCRAFLTAISIIKSKKSDMLHDDEHFDVVMERARKLDILYADYLSVMREKLASREIEVRMPNPFSGKVEKVQDSDVFGFDEYSLSVEKFHEMIKAGQEFLPTDN